MGKESRDQKTISFIVALFATLMVFVYTHNFGISAIPMMVWGYTAYIFSTFNKEKYNGQEESSR